MSDPVFSVGAYGRNAPFREDIVGLVNGTTVSVANGHPSVPSPLEMVNGGES